MSYVHRLFTLFCWLFKAHLRLWRATSRAFAFCTEKNMVFFSLATVLIVFKNFSNEFLKTVKIVAKWKNKKSRQTKLHIMRVEMNGNGYYIWTYKKWSELTQVPWENGEPKFDVSHQIQINIRIASYSYVLVLIIITITCCLPRMLNLN